MAHVFLSYVREDAPTVDRLATALRAHGIEVWLDRENIAAGSRWKSAIRAAIRSGDFFLACFSGHSSQRHRTYMNEELTLAIDELRLRPTDRGWFLPVMLTDTSIPDRDIGGGETLSCIQCVALYRDWSDGIRRILDVIPSSATKIDEERLQGSMGKEAITRVLRNLEYADIYVAYEASELTCHGAAAVPILVEALATTSDKLFCNIATVLGGMGREAHAATAPLCRLLAQQQPPHSNDRRLRAIAHALGDIGDARAVGPLAEALLWEKHKASYRLCWQDQLHTACALHSLGNMSKSTLQALLHSNEPRARVRAANVLYWTHYSKRRRHIDDALDSHTLSLLDAMTTELINPALTVEILSYLREIGQHAAFKATAILPLLDERDRITRITAIETLRSLHSKDPQVIARLQATTDVT